MKRLGLVVSLVMATFAPSIAFADDDDTDDEEVIAPLPPPAPPVPTTATATATATPSGSTSIDSVHLRSGGLYRGRVTEIVPGDHVTVVVAPGGETKRIAWPEIDRVIVASTPIPPAPTTAAPVATPPAAPAPMVGPRARVHITSKKPVILYRRAAGTSSFVEVCKSPCDLDLPLGDTYRIAGSGLSQNKELTLDGRPGGTVDIVVDPPSIPGMLLGGFAAGIGWTVAYVGLLMSAANSARGDDDEGALVTLLVGAAMSTAGVIIFLKSATTDVTQRSGGDAREASVRKPSWLSLGSRATEAAAGAAPASFPLMFTGRF